MTPSTTSQPTRRPHRSHRSHRSVAASWATVLFVSSLAVAALGVAGCGKKGDPQPPVRTMPARTTGLQAIQRGNALLLSFPYPKTTPAGTALAGISRVDLVSMTFPAPSGDERIPDPPRAQFDRAATTETVLELGDLATAVQGDRVLFRVPLPARTTTDGREALSLGIRTLAEGGEISDLSDLVTVELQEPPEPPREVVAEPGPDGVLISWDYPRREDVLGEDEEDTDDSEDSEDSEDDGTDDNGEDTSADEDENGWIVGFHVYRRSASARTYGDPIARPRARFRQFEDETARVGERYIYTVTAVATRRPMVVESAPSAEIEVDYRDRFAPPPPEGLVALPEETAAGLSIRLVWEPSDTDDLAGYRVYRQLPGEGEASQLGDLVPRPEITDTDLPTEGTVLYRVSAVDTAGNESGASREVSVRLR